jgi:hypothetical protein
VTLNYGLNKAISYDETGFLGREDEKYVRQAWNFMLAGGSVFNGLDYSFSPGHEDGSDLAPNGPGGGSPELRRRLQILQQFLESLPLAKMKPDPGTVLRASGVYTHTLSSETGVYAIYLDGNGPAELGLELPAGEYSVEWIDTLSGRASSLETIKSQGRETVVHSPDFRGGIALILQRK